MSRAIMRLGITSVAIIDGGRGMLRKG